MILNVNDETLINSVEVIWKNGSPGSAFSTQSINNLDLSKYDFIGMICNYYNTYPNRLMPIAMCPVEVGKQCASMSPSTIRTMEVTSLTSVNIGGTSNADTKELVPCYILGFKGV